jgi:hypothetical protein
MDKVKVDASVSIEYNSGAYSIVTHKKDLTRLEIINLLCKEAAEQDKTIIKASIDSKPVYSILTHNVDGNSKSL